MANDLLYVGNAEGYARLQKDMLHHWPQATFEDASDMIHEDRFSVTIPGVDQDEYILAALVNGFFSCSFTWEMLKATDPRKAQALINIAGLYLQEKAEPRP